MSVILTNTPSVVDEPRVIAKGVFVVAKTPGCLGSCPAGTETRWSFGDDENKLGDYAWYLENAYDIDEKYAHQVELKKPNAFGLYDMHGNVFEWCHDYYGEDYYKQSSEKDPTGPTSGSSRVLRGGSWGGSTRISRSAYRYRFVADGRFNFVGFRLVRELD